MFLKNRVKMAGVGPCILLLDILLAACVWLLVTTINSFLHYNELGLGIIAIPLVLGLNMLFVFLSTITAHGTLELLKRLGVANPFIVGLMAQLLVIAGSITVAAAITFPFFSLFRSSASITYSAYLSYLAVLLGCCGLASTYYGVMADFVVHRASDRVRLAVIACSVFVIIGAVLYVRQGNELAMYNQIDTNSFTVYAPLDYPGITFNSFNNDGETPTNSNKPYTVIRFSLGGATNGEVSEYKAKPNVDPATDCGELYAGQGETWFNYNCSFDTTLNNGYDVFTGDLTQGSLYMVRGDTVIFLRSTAPQSKQLDLMEAMIPVNGRQFFAKCQPKSCPQEY